MANLLKNLLMSRNMAKNNKMLGNNVSDLLEKKF